MLNTLFRRRPLIEELEPRLLFSADLAPVAIDSLQAVPEQRVLDTNGEFTAATTATQARQELVIIDSRVDNLDALLADINAQSQAGRHIDVVVLDPNQDGIAQITAALQGHGQIDALHIISHGENGQLQLGSTWIDSASLNAQSSSLQAWGGALTADADILLYGCDVAAGEAGQQFVQTLSSLTGADVAASTDLTGSATQGGDWVLEAQTGHIETTVAINAAGQAEWDGVLASDITVNQINPNDQNTASLNRGSQQAVAYDAAGNFVVVWTSKFQDGDGYGVYARRFAADGTPLTDEFLVNSTTTNDQTYASVVSDNAGNFVVTWTSKNQDGSGLGVYVRRFAADGTPLTGEIKVNTTTAGDQSNSVISMDRTSGEFVVAWQGAGPGDAQGIFFRRFAADGSALDVVDQRANLTDSGNERNPAMAMDSSGNFVIAYEVSNHMYFQRFNQAGVAQGGRVQVDNGFSTSTGASIAMDGSGNFTIVYREQNILTGIWGRGYYADGTQRYSLFQPATGDSSSPSIAMDASGAFVVTYQKTGVNGQDIYARKYNADASSNGSAFIVNQYTNSDQVAPSIAMLDMDHYVVVWSGKSASDSNAVSARIFAPPDTTAPVITSDGGGNTASLSIAENTTAVTTVIASDADGPVQTLTYSISGGADAVKFTIDSATGVLSLIAAPNYEAPADSGANNVYDVTVQVSDGTLTDTQAISVSVGNANEAPVASDDLYAVDQNTTLTVPAGTGLIANDSDPDNDTLSVASSSTPSHGALLLTTSDGAFIYTPNAGYVGSDSFTYTITDGNGHTSDATASININAVNVAPATTPVTLSPIAEDSGPRIITQAELLANASDANGDSLSATGLAISSGSGTLLDSGNGTWTYTSALNDNSSVSFSYTITDGSLTAAGSAALDITPVNDAPTASNSTINATEDVVYSSSLPAATDVESDPITYALDTQAANGTVAVNATGSYTYAPNANYNGPDSFSYTVSDNHGGSNTYTVTVNVLPVNDAPVANNDTFTGSEDNALVGNVLDNDADVENDSLTAILVSGPANGSLVLNADGSFNYTPSANFNGVDSFTYKANDGSADSNVATVSLTINPVNDAPTITDGATVTLTATNEDTSSSGTTVNTILTGASWADVDSAASKGIAITSVTGNGTWQYSTDGVTWTGFGTVNSGNALLLTSTSRVRYVPNGLNGETATFGFQAWDQTMGTASANTLPSYANAGVNGGTTAFGSAIASSSIVVTPVNDAPVITLPASQPAAMNVPIVFSSGSGNLISINDVDAGSSPVQITLDIKEGKLSLSGISGLSFSNGTGTDDTKMVFTGTLADINAALNGMVYTPKNNYAGNNAKITVTVNDLGNTGAGGALNSTGITAISFSNVAPVAQADSYSVNEDITLTVAAGTGVLANDSDANGDSITAAVVSGPAHGALVLNADGSFTYTPTANWNGTDSFSYKANDGSVNSNAATVTLTVDLVNDAPSGANNTVTTLEDTAYVFATSDFGFTDSNDSPANALLNVKITTLPGAGTLTDNSTAVSAGQFVSATDIAAGKLVFTQASNANGPGYASFTFQVQDSGGTTSGGIDLDPTPKTMTVNVTAVDDAPTTTPVNLTPIAEDSGARLITQAELLASASDIDGPSLGATGLAIASGSGSLVDNGDGTWTYTPALNGDTSVSFSYSVTDGSLTAPGVASLDITPVNDAPTATPVNLAPIAEDSGPYVITQAELLANATDVDSPSLSAAGLTIASGSGSLVNNGDGTWTYTPALNDDTSVSFSYSVSDGSLTAAGSASLDIMPVNDGPVGNNDSASGNEDTAITGNVLANDTDIDNVGLTAALVSGPTHGNLTLNADGSYTYIPNANWNGSDSFTYTANDGALDSNIATVSLTVNPVNDAPTTTLVTLAPIAEDSGARLITQAELLANASDVDGPSLTATGLMIASGSGTLVNNANGTWSYTPALNDDTAVSFSYIVTDGSLNVAGSALLDITPVNDAPTLSANLPSIGPGQTHVITTSELQATDPDNTSTQLNYVLTSAPANGTLTLNGSALALNGTFTQADVDSGRISYTNTNVSSTSDAFAVTVTDTQGAATPITPIAFLITQPAAPPVDGGAPVAPLPAPALPPVEVAPGPPTAPPAAEPDASATRTAPGIALIPLATTPADEQSAGNETGPVTAAGKSASAPNSAGMRQSAYLQTVSLTLPKAGSESATPLLSSLVRALDAISTDTQAMEALQASLGNNSFQQQLNSLQNDINQQLHLDKTTVASSLVVSTGLSVGYVLWLVRGGVLLSSLLSTLPAWRLIDPLPILGYLDRGKRGGGEDDSLEGMLKKSADRDATVGKPPVSGESVEPTSPAA